MNLKTGIETKWHIQETGKCMNSEQLISISGYVGNGIERGSHCYWKGLENSTGCQI